MASITVIIPTLNEVENIDLLLTRVCQVRKKYELNFQILFVDSASKDGTAEKVDCWKGETGVHILRREVNLGLADAVIAGARYATSDYVLVMDADLSHPPEMIPALLQPLLTDTFDMVVGSRYVDGASMPDWPFSRKISSRIATWPALFFCDVKDPLAGYFCVSRKLLAELPGTVPGFKIGLAILAEYQEKLRVKEIPIEFRDRDYGRSKMGKRIAFDYVKQLSRLAVKKYWFENRA